jgi:hypothetical protein
MDLHAGDLDYSVEPGVRSGRLRIENDQGAIEGKSVLEHSQACYQCDSPTLTLGKNGLPLAPPCGVLIPMFPRVTGLKIEHFWRRGSRAAVRCTVRFSRRLRAEEAERIKGLANAFVARAEVVHECGADEVEEWHTKLLDALAGTATVAPRRVSVGERHPRRSPLQKGRNAPPPQRDPAA